ASIAKGLHDDFRRREQSAGGKERPAFLPRPDAAKTRLFIDYLVKEFKDKASRLPSSTLPVTRTRAAAGKLGTLLRLLAMM
ncbi:hypothetical protein ACC731_38065, partial [Rhizobium ruizarguesonis]